jgi:RecB family exonuclease
MRHIMSKAAPWSFSRIKAFEQCPKQFYHEKVLKQYPFIQTDAMIYGNQFHKACEDYIGKGEPLPERFMYIKDALDKLNQREGVKICEQRLGVTANLEPCTFGARNVWFRGIVDLAILDEDSGIGWIIDYKTGKSAKYADKGQLELMALAIFAHYPKITSIRAGLLFVVANKLVKETYEVADRANLWEKWSSNYATMEQAFEADVWNPRPSGLCKRHCPVTECAHNGSN